MAKTIIGVMGPGEKAQAHHLLLAAELGKLIAQQGWVLLTGGRKVGVMAAASEGAKAAGGLTLGILPTASVQDCSEAIDLPILTDLGNARNAINILSSHLVIACGIGLGTASEVALALKSDKPVILLATTPITWEFFKSLKSSHLWEASNPQEAINLAKTILN